MDHTLAQLEKILKDICDKTGVRVRLRPGASPQTAFALELPGGTYTAYLDGDGEEADRMAKLVRYLVANADFRSLLPDRGERLRGILLGEESEWDVFRFLTRYAIPDGACTAIDIVPDKRLPEAEELINECISETRDLAVAMDQSRFAVIRFSDADQSAVEFGQFLWQSMYEELGVHASIGIGCEVAKLSEIALSYGQAVTAVRMGGMFGNAGEVHSYRE